MFHFVQEKFQGSNWAENNIQCYKKEAKEWEDDVKKNEEVVKKLEKKREQYEGES